MEVNPYSEDSLPTSRRNVWATLCAAGLTASHCLAVLVVLGWIYLIVPRWKMDINHLQRDTTQTVKFLIGRSDWIVNFWYLLVPLAPVAVLVEFVLLRWMAKYLGPTKTLVAGLCLFLLILGNIVLGQSILSRELSRLRAMPLPVQPLSIPNQ